MLFCKALSSHMFLNLLIYVGADPKQQRYSGFVRFSGMISLFDHAGGGAYVRHDGTADF